MIKLRIGLVLFTLIALSISCRPIPTDIDENFPDSETDTAIAMPEINSFEDVLKLQPELINIANICFLLEVENGWADDKQRTKAEKVLQGLEHKAARKIRSYDNGERRVRKLISTIFDSGFRVDKLDPDGHNPENLYLSSVLTRRKGYCVSLSFVALAVADRLEKNRNLVVPVRGVRAPKHFFVRYVSENKGLEKNFEMTNYGATHDKFEYLKTLDLPLAYVNLKPYFNALDKKQIFSDLLNNLGANYALERKYADALRWLKIASKFDLGNPQPLYNQAFIYEQKEDFGSAISFLNQTIALDSNFYEARTARGRLYCDLGNPREGLKDFEFAIENYKNRHEAYLMRGVHFAKNKEYEAALTDLQRAKNVNPIDKDTNVNLLNLYLRQNMLTKAEPIVDILKKIAPDDPQATKLFAIYRKLSKEKEK